jgi:hypothetical protein
VLTGHVLKDAIVGQGAGSGSAGSRSSRQAVEVDATLAAVERAMGLTGA